MSTLLVEPQILLDFQRTTMIGLNRIVAQIIQNKRKTDQVIHALRIISPPSGQIKNCDLLIRNRLCSFRTDEKDCNTLCL